MIDKLPALTEDDIDDRNKGDFLVKGLTLLQVTYFIVQIMARAVSQKTPAQLEIVVLAFAACTCVTYSFAWGKPQDVRTVKIVPASRYPTALELARIAVHGPVTWGHRRDNYWIPNNASHCAGLSGLGLHTKLARASLLSAIMFGGLHCAAWYFTFPTPVEQKLWRIAAISTTCTFPAALVPNMIFGRLSAASKSVRMSTIYRALNGTVSSASALLYVIARLYVTVEIFRSLCFLDPVVYETTWSRFFPHGS